MKKSHNAGVPRAALWWIVGDDTGASSEAIWEHMVTGDCQSPRAPCDGDDFGRCYRLLKAVPEWRDRIGEMARYGAYWKVLVDHWKQLEWRYEGNGDTRSMYGYMQDLRKQARE